MKVEDAVPAIIAEDPRPLLFHARDNAFEKVENTEEVRLKGWRRIVQVGCANTVGDRLFNSKIYHTVYPSTLFPKDASAELEGVLSLRQRLKSLLRKGRVYSTLISVLYFQYFEWFCYVSWKNRGKKALLLAS